MPTRNQHFVPRTYLKAWESSSSDPYNPSRQRTGLYVHEKDGSSSRYANKVSVMWQPHLYTVKFDQRFIGQYCPMITSDFVKQTFKLMRNRMPQPVYGKHGYSIIRTRESVRKHFDRIDEWEFFYDDGNIARKKGILADIHAQNSYILEDAFDSVFETNWETVLQSFLQCFILPLHRSNSTERITIPPEVAQSIFSFFFMMLCRNPRFDGLTWFSWIQENMIDAFGEESRLAVEEYRQGLWLTELYKMLFDKKSGFYHTFMRCADEQNQMMLYEASDNAGLFITSDNPAFMNISSLAETENTTGYYFPLTPKHLLMIGRGDRSPNVVLRRYADRDTVTKFNHLIRMNASQSFISSKPLL